MRMVRILLFFLGMHYADIFIFMPPLRCLMVIPIVKTDKVMRGVNRLQPVYHRNNYMAYAVVLHPFLFTKKGVPHITLMTIAQEQRAPYLRYNGGIPEESQRQISTIVM